MQLCLLLVFEENFSGFKFKLYYNLNLSEIAKLALKVVNDIITNIGRKITVKGCISLNYELWNSFVKLQGTTISKTVLSYKWSEFILKRPLFT